MALFEALQHLSERLKESHTSHWSGY